MRETISPVSKTIILDFLPICQVGVEKIVSLNYANIDNTILPYKAFDLTGKFLLKLDPYFLIVLTSSLLVITRLESSLHEMIL